MQSSLIFTRTRGLGAIPAAKQLAPTAALLAALLVAGCLDEDDPVWGSSNNAVDAGGNGATSGGNGATPGGNGATPGGNGATPGGNGGTAGIDASVSAPIDASGPVGNDASSAVDAGAVGSGPDAGVQSPASDGGDAGATGASNEGGLPDAASSGPPDAASSGGSDASTTAPRPDQGKGDGSDVLMIGDSWMSLGGAESGIQGGVLKASGQPYRAYAIPGTTLLGGGVLDIFVGPITSQYTQAIQADKDVKTVIMTAGGNDILQTGLQDDCQMDGDACGEQVTKILAGLSQLWADMAADGVQDIVYILYATPEGESVDFLLPDGDGARRRCENVPAPLRCHIVETLDIVMGDIPDGIHPSQAASDRIGKAVVDLMAARGIRR